jgi:L-lactate dehydrogenase complex protein LldG
MAFRNTFSETKRIQSMRSAFNTVKKRQKKTSLPDLEERKKRLRKMKELSLGNKKLIDLAGKNLKKNGFIVRIASTREEAIDHILKEIGDEKVVVKSKSNTMNNLNVSEVLTSRNIEVIETDIGDRILQLAEEKPSHPTGPASHLDRYEISDILSGYRGEPVSSDTTELIRLIKEEIQEKISDAGVGLTGANAITAEEGSVVLVHNEGNITEVMLRPKKHIIVVGTEKIVPDLEEALNLIKLQIYCATGSKITSHINIIGGPSKTADIEKKIFRGIHGPSDICIILVKNDIDIPSEYSELLYCIGCGGCLLDCPVYNIHGNKFGGSNNLGCRGVILSAVENKEKISKDHNIYTCLECGKCKKICPVNVDFPVLVRKIRTENLVFSSHPQLEIIFGFLYSHLKWIHGLVRFRTLELASRVYKQF